MNASYETKQNLILIYNFHVHKHAIPTKMLSDVHKILFKNFIVVSIQTQS